jgi:YHS domain-containing protein
VSRKLFCAGSEATLLVISHTLRAECAFRFCDFGIYRKYPREAVCFVVRIRAKGKLLYRRGNAMTKDPVCGMNVDENNSQYQSEHKGKQYSFCSEQCKNKFDQHPEQYARSAA